MKPLGDTVLIIPDCQPVKSGDIYLPSTVDNVVVVGEVFAVGQDARFVQPGNRVVYSKWGGTQFDLDGKTFRVLSESGIYAVV